jgi:CHAT domain-containing protein
VHIACHGFVDAEEPLLSRLALTPGPGDDGFVTLLDDFRMKVPADIVVLSACVTGRGSVLEGEGMVGLMWSFHFAGSPRVLASLWDVDDEATKELMVRFYGAWKEGKGAAAALREAQASVRCLERWRHPRYWAAWVLWGLPE